MSDIFENGPRIYAAIAIFIGAVLAFVIWTIKHHRSPILKIDSHDSIAGLIPSLAGLTLGSACTGNSVEVLLNGRFFDVMIERIAAAQKSVHFETFLWKDGVLGRRVADALSAQARAGRQVRVMLDANGSKEIGKEVVAQMRAAGCRVKFFHKCSLLNLAVMNNRTHRKMVIIDGREAFVGGHCIVDTWLGDGQDKDHVFDVSVRLHGPIVGSVQAAFSENWAGQTGELFLGDDYFPLLAPAGDIVMHAAYAMPERSAPAVKILHHTVICLARKRIWIQNPYFIPEPEAIDAMGAAVKRGVDVRVLMPSTSGSDNPMVQHAGHRNFEKLLRCGVRLFEYPHTLLHHKVMTVDCIWTAIGSANFDDRSFETNYEITLGILDEAMAAEMDALFEKHVPDCREVELEKWRKRGLWHKLKDNVFYIFNEML